MVEMGSHQTLWSLPLPNVTWHSGTWPYTMTPSIDQTSHQFANLLPNWTLLPILTLLPNFGCFHRTLQRVRLANRGRLLFRTPCPVPFGTCICSNVETILSWTCHVYGTFEFQTSLGIFILLLSHLVFTRCKLTYPYKINYDDDKTFLKLFQSEHSPHGLRCNCNVSHIEQILIDFLNLRQKIMNSRLQRQRSSYCCYWSIFRSIEQIYVKRVDALIRSKIQVLRDFRK